MVYRLTIRRCSITASFGLLFAVLLTLSQPAFCHGGVSMENDVCTLRLGAYVMHFTGYQPQATGSREFCEDIPETGKTIVVLDAVDEALRDIPIEVRILRDTGDESNLETITAVSLAPKVYPSGSIALEYTFDKAGKFIGLITAGARGEYVSRFPFSVASGKSVYGKYLVFLTVPLVGFALYRYSVRARKKAQPRQSAPPV
jgi:hypothetical protein